MKKLFTASLLIMIAGCDNDDGSDKAPVFNYSLQDKKIAIQDDTGSSCYAFGDDNQLQITTRSEGNIVELTQTSWSQANDILIIGTEESNWALKSLEDNVLTIAIDNNTRDIEALVADSFSQLSSEDAPCTEVVGVPDSDADKIPDILDPDDDNDNILDKDDQFPEDPSESIDTDNDGIGDNEDTDDDNDLVPDEYDLYPLDSSKSVELLPATPFELASGEHHTCIITDNDVTCWGRNDHGQTDVPPGIVNPTMIASRGNHNCVLDDNGVICWGNNFSGQTDVSPGLQNPRQIGVGLDFSCALDDNGVQCWGDNGFGQINVPAMTNPSKLYVGHGHSCVLDDEGAKCWGTDRFLKSWDGFSLETIGNANEINGVQDITDLVVGARIMCFIAERRSQCRYPAFLSEARGLTHNRDIDEGEVHACILSSYGINCYGDDSEGQLDVPPKIYRATAVSVGELHSCALTDANVLCWGNNDYGQLDIPSALSENQ